jgi:hypothetical protein
MALSCHKLLIPVMHNDGYSCSLDDLAVSVRNARLCTGIVTCHVNKCAPTSPVGESGRDHAMVLEE